MEQITVDVMTRTADWLVTLAGALRTGTFAAPLRALESGLHREALNISKNLREQARLTPAVSSAYVATQYTRAADAIEQLLLLCDEQRAALTATQANLSVAATLRDWNATKAASLWPVPRLRGLSLREAALYALRYTVTKLLPASLASRFLNMLAR